VPKRCYCGGKICEKERVISNKLICTFLALFLIFSFLTISFAESLSEVKKNLTKPSLSPSKDKDAQKRGHKLQGLEEGLARQYRIPVSQVINYEMMLENNIHVYHSIYFLQKRHCRIAVHPCGGQLEELAEKAPPYSFLLYLTSSKSRKNYRNELKDTKGL
jgi:hypothetical protein